MMSSHEDDLDLLLSLQDRVLETPPASPSPRNHLFLFHSSSSSSSLYMISLLLTIHSTIAVDFDDDDDNVSPKHKQREKPDMSVFKDAVQDCLHYQPSNPNPKPKPNSKPLTDDAQLDKFSGLRIRYVPSPFPFLNFSFFLSQFQ